MIDLTGPLVRARLTMLLGGRPFDLERIPVDQRHPLAGDVWLSIHHEHRDVGVGAPLRVELLDEANTEELRSRLASMVACLDREAFPDRHRRILEASREVRRIMDAEPAGLHAWHL